MLEIITNLVNLLAGNLNLFFILALVCIALLGDASLIFFTAFSVSYGINLWIVFWAAFIGNIIGDTGWFIIGRILTPHVEKRKHLNKHYKKIAEVIEFIFKKQHFLALTVVKFLYGTRVITIIYLSKERMRLWRFIVYDAFATLIWVLGVGIVGYFVGLGYVWVKTIFKSTTIILTIVVFFFILFYLLQKKINKRIENITDTKLKKAKKNKKL